MLILIACQCRVNWRCALWHHHLEEHHYCKHELHHAGNANTTTSQHITTKQSNRQLYNPRQGELPGRLRTKTAATVSSIHHRHRMYVRGWTTNYYIVLSPRSDSREERLNETDWRLRWKRALELHPSQLPPRATKRRLLQVWLCRRVVVAGGWGVVGNYNNTLVRRCA